MKLVVLLTIVLAVACDEIELLTKWEQFKSEYSKKYHTHIEDGMRQRLWLENLKFVEEHNKLYQSGKVTYFLAQNHLSDMTKEERKRLLNFHLSQKPAANAVYNVSGKMVPPSIDWRTKGAVNQIKNQGQCTSSWAFSAIAAIETQYWIRTKTLKSFSEQQLVDCVDGTSCDNGGLMVLVYEYLQNHGLESDSYYRYMDGDGPCQYDKSKVEMKGIRDYVDLRRGDENVLRDAIANVGVISIAVNAGREDFHFYSGGVYAPDECDPEDLDHGVAAIGYGTDATGGDYFLIRNSWGTKWGMQGYMQIARNKENLCGVATIPTYPIIDV